MNTPEIVTIEEKKLLGMKVEMSLSEHKTFQLWRRFKPQVQSILNKVGTDFYSLQVYPKEFGTGNFTTTTKFIKWAAIEVSDYEKQLDIFEKMMIPSGKYAVFIHKGTSAEFSKTAYYIYNVWLPKSGYQLADKPHFEVLGDKYILNHADSEERVWIPII
jgi:AraC family transcriptional regulator